MKTPVKKWALQYALALPVIFALLAAVQYLKGHNFAYSMQFGMFWALLSVVIFAIRRYYNFRKNIACALCKDLPEDHQN